jgi:hypothetical protein
MEISPESASDQLPGGTLLSSELWICYSKPTGDYQNFSRSEWYCWTERGLQWIKGAEPIPEAVTKYMNFLREHVPTLDDVIFQYILEALEAFNREANFAAAVRVGTASEKAVYLLAAPC